MKTFVFLFIGLLMCSFCYGEEIDQDKQPLRCLVCRKEIKSLNKALGGCHYFPLCSKKCYDKGLTMLKFCLLSADNSITQQSKEIKGGKMNEKKKWLDPTTTMLGTSEFNAIWNCIKTWDINVPEVYEGYCGATGNHVRAILDALKESKCLGE